MGVLDVVNAGVLTGNEAKNFFAYAKRGFCNSTVNVVGTDSINAVLEAASKVKISSYSTIFKWRTGFYEEKV